MKPFQVSLLLLLKKTEILPGFPSIIIRQYETFPGFPPIIIGIYEIFPDFNLDLIHAKISNQRQKGNKENTRTGLLANSY